MVSQPRDVGNLLNHSCTSHFLFCTCKCLKFLFVLLCQANLVAAFEQSLVNMTSRLRHLAETAEEKVRGPRVNSKPTSQGCLFYSTVIAICSLMVRTGLALSLHVKTVSHAPHSCLAPLPFPVESSTIPCPVPCKCFRRASKDATIISFRTPSCWICEKL